MTSDYEVLTPKEVCEMLHIHRATLYKLIRKGKLPSFKIGGDWRFRQDVILRWIAEQTVG
jgi:excisionase family DNA binding protein